MLVNNLARISEEFGRIVRDRLKEKGWSFRRACIATGVDYGTIGNMADGIVPRKGHVIDWAIGLGEDINYWLALAGYDTIPPKLVSGAEEVREATEEYRPLPDPVRQAIEAAGSTEDKISLAFEHIRKDPFVGVGNSATAEYSIEAKLSIIRMYERHTKRRVLPPEAT